MEKPPFLTAILGASQSSARSIRGQFKMALVSCGECGKQISDQAVACPSCGAPVSNRAVQTLVTAPKSRSMAVLLAMLLGGIGIHRFYLNEPGWGVLYLLFCWTFIPAIAGLIEGLVLLFMSDTEFQRAYGSTVG
jgi:TM2 domain-containing membrane protein YozV